MNKNLYTMFLTVSLFILGLYTITLPASSEITTLQPKAPAKAPAQGSSQSPSQTSAGAPSQADVQYAMSFAKYFADYNNNEKALMAEAKQAIPHMKSFSEWKPFYLKKYQSLSNSYNAFKSLKPTSQFSKVQNSILSTLHQHMFIAKRGIEICDKSPNDQAAIRNFENDMNKVLQSYFSVGKDFGTITASWPEPYKSNIKKTMGF